jgi:hypothetical protein
MAEDRMAVLEAVRKAIGDGDVDFQREGARVLAQAVMEAEVTQLLAARSALPGASRIALTRLGHVRGYARTASTARGRPRWPGAVACSKMLVTCFSTVRSVMQEPVDPEASQLR